MSFLNAMRISASGLKSQRLRMNVLSNNLANAHTTVTPEGGPYKRQDVVFSAVPLEKKFESFLDEAYMTELKKVKVVDIHQDKAPPRKVFDPKHPQADDKGYVSMPNIHVMSEMVNMIMATRAYEANVTALDNTKQMMVKALEIGR